MTKTISALMLGTSLVLGAPSAVIAQDKTAKIGVLTDQSGLYADISGAGSVLAAQMAIEDSGLTTKGWKIEVIAGDHQNKADIGVNIARQWIDVEKVDVIADVPTSSVALAVHNLVKEKNVVLLNSGGGTSDLTNKACTPNTIHWTYDTYMLAHGTGSALTKSGENTWFFLIADYAFGSALERDATEAITAVGGKVVGSVRHPLNTPDFSSFLLQHNPPRQRLSGWGTPAATPSMPSSKHRSSASLAAARNLPGYCCSYRTSTRWV